MSSFLESKAHQTLSELASFPYDLTKSEALHPKRFETMTMSNLGIQLMYATERVSNEVMEALYALSDECRALDKMHQMQSGQIINTIEGYGGEDRAVLHTAMRDFFDHKDSSEVAKEAANAAYKELEKLTHFLKDFEGNENFTDIVQIGIGGSDLGPRAIYTALKAYQKKARRAHFISNVDPDDAADVLRSLDLAKTLFVVVSKSGTTLETLTNEELIRDRLKLAGLEPKNHMIAVTAKASPMDDASKYLASFYIWDYVGGRYSVTSMVGGVLLAFAFGMDKFLDFLRGASAMDKAALKKENNLPLLSALLSIWNRNFLNYQTQAIIPYSQALSRFPAHLQQLAMESNGKRIDKKGKATLFDTGAIYWGEPGTNSQHSFFQLLHQGSTIVPVEFLGFGATQYKQDLLFHDTTCQEKLLSNMLAQVIALAEGEKSDHPNKVFPGNRPSRIVFAERLDPYHLGLLLSYYEHSVAFQGFIWNINSFDQEGVQLGKVLAAEFIEMFKAKRAQRPSDSKGVSASHCLFKQIEYFLKL